MKLNVKSLIALTLILAFLALPMTIFANTDSNGPAPKVNMEERIAAVFNARQGQIDELRAQTEEKKHASKVLLMGVIETYAPELEESFQSLWAAHEALHISLVAEQQRIASESQAKTEAFFNSIKAQVLDKTLTREEAKAAMLEYRENAKTEKNTMKEEVVALKASIDIPRETIKALSDALKVAVEDDNQAEVEATLLAMIDQQKSHLVFDQAKLELMMTR